jgi:hypothetical protein
LLKYSHFDILRSPQRTRYPITDETSRASAQTRHSLYIQHQIPSHLEGGEVHVFDLCHQHTHLSCFALPCCVLLCLSFVQHSAAQHDATQLDTVQSHTLVCACCQFTGRFNQDLKREVYQLLRVSLPTDSSLHQTIKAISDHHCNNGAHQT